MMDISSLPQEHVRFLMEQMLLTLLATFWMAIPVWGAALRAFPRKWGLSHPWRFTAIAAALSYGPPVAVLLILFAPIVVGATFLAPQLSEVGSAVGPWMIRLNAIASDAWFLLVLLLPAFAWNATRCLARKWARACPT